MVRLALVCAAAAAAALAWALYNPGIDYEFTFDDHRAIERNADSRWGAPWGDLLEHDFWGDNLTHVHSHKSWRPLVIVSFRLNDLADGLTPHWYHVVNMALHAALSAVVAGLAYTLTASGVGAGVAGAVFAVHPVHVEAVANIVGRAELMCAVFFMGAVALYEAPRGGAARWALFVLAFGGAVLCKETGLMIPAVCAAMDLVTALDATAWAGARWRLLARWALLGALGAGYFALRMQLMTTTSWREATVSSAVARRAENPFAFLHGPAWLLSTTYLQAYYAGMLLYPVHLSCEYSYNCIPAVETVRDPRNLASLALAGAIAAVAGVLARTRSRRLARCLVWALVPFLPAANVFTRIGTLVAERLLYLPSVGYCLGLGLAVARVMGMDAKARGCLVRALQVLTLLAVTGYTGALYMRSAARVPEWATDTALFNAALRTCPNSAKLHGQAANMAIERGALDEAWGEILTVRAIDPDHCDVEHITAVYYVRRGDPEAAWRHLKAAVTCVFVQPKVIELLMQVWQLLEANAGGPTPFTHVDRAEVYLVIGNRLAAGMHYREGGVLQWRQGNHAAALSIMRDGIAAVPERCDLYYWYIWMLRQAGEEEDPGGYESSSIMDVAWRGIECAVRPNATVSAEFDYRPADAAAHLLDVITTVARPFLARSDVVMLRRVRVRRAALVRRIADAAVEVHAVYVTAPAGAYSDDVMSKVDFLQVAGYQYNTAMHMYAALGDGSAAFTMATKADALPREKRPCMFDLAYAQMLIARASVFDQRIIQSHLRAALECPKTRAEAAKLLRAGGWGSGGTAAAAAVSEEEDSEEM